MKGTKQLVVPVCDIALLHGNERDLDSFTKYSSWDRHNKEKEYSQTSDFNMRRTRQRKRELEIEVKPEIKEESEEENENESDYVLESEDEENKHRNDLSEYEKMVQKNREERVAFLQSLKIDEVKEEFKEAVSAVSTPRIRRTPKPRVFKKPRTSELTPVRKSRRLAKLEVNLSEEALYAKAIAEVSEEEKRKILPPVYPFEEAIQDKEDYSDFMGNFQFTAEVDAKFNKNYVSHFAQMKLKESNIAKVVPTRITTLTVHPTTDNVIVIAGSKFGHLGFWNVTRDSNPIVFTPHNGGVTNLKINPNNPLQIVSSSYDGTMRCGDVEKKIFNEVYNVSEETCCTYFDFMSSTAYLVALRNGNVSVVDSRSGRLKSEKSHECSDYSIKTVNVHPVNRNLFLTADIKGFLKLWDLRKLQKKPVISVPYHKRSVASAFFSPVTGNSILTTSSDDSLCIFDSSNVEKEILFKKSIKHNNFTGRWLTPFKATWLPNSDDAFVVGSMLYPRRIEIFNGKGTDIYNFKDENLTSVTSVNQFHPSLNVLAGGNSSGKVFVFMDTELNF